MTSSTATEKSDDLTLSGAEIARDDAEQTEHEISRLASLLVPVTAEQARKATLPDALVEGLIYAGHFTLLAGGAKQGKSTLAIQLALAVSNDNYFCRSTTTRTAGRA